MKTEWQRYLKYLLLWTVTHQEEECKGMSPACFDEFCDNDDEPEYYDENLDYDTLGVDLETMLNNWENCDD